MHSFLVAVDSRRHQRLLCPKKLAFVNGMIPLRQFIPSGNRRSGEQKAIVPSSRKRQRSDDGSPNEERSAPSSSGSKQKTHVANKKAPLAYEAAPLSDNSDFDRNDAPAEDELRQRTGKMKKNEAKPTKSRKSKNSDKRLAKVSHDQSSEDEDSQTFAVFKMRTANQEQARKEAERESLKIRQPSYTDTGRTNGKKHTDINSSQSSGSSRGSFKEQHQNSLVTISGMTQSVQLSKRARLQSSVFGHDESLPYHVMQLKSAIVEEDGEDLQDDQELLQSGLGPKKTEENDGNRMIPSFPPKPENGKTLLDLLVKGSQQRQADAQKKQGHRRERPDGSNTESGPDSSPNEEDDSSQVVNGLKKPENIKINEEDSSDDGDEDDEILRFDTVTGELIRPVNAKNASVKKGISEPGQSEEENDFVPTLADAPKSSKSKSLTSEGARAKLSMRLNAEAEAKARELGMKPAFRCSAAKQRKKPYSLDPNNAEVVVPISISRFLRRYQRVGVQFFYDRYVGIKVDDIGIVKGGVLGDDMGLGKTIQVLAFLSAVMDKTGTDVDLLESRSRKGRARRREGSYTPFTFGPTCLITCPKTLVNNWKREIETWTNLEFGVIESKADRDSVIVKYKNGFLDLVLVPFDRLVGDIDVLKTLEFSIMIIDEAHSIKNATAARSIAMKSILARCRFAMTGTLIQNRYEEMWSVLDFVVPGLVGRYDQWKNIFAKAVEAGMDLNATVGVIAEKQRVMDRLQQFIIPLLFLRRTKAEVALELPSKNDQVIFCPLTPIQAMIYRRIAAQPELQAFLRRQAPCPEHPNRRFKDCCGSSIKFEDVDSGIVFRYIDIFKKVASHIGLVYSESDDKAEQKMLCQKLLDICFPLDRDEQIQPVNLFEGAGIEGYIPEGLIDIAEELGPNDRDLRYRKLRRYEATATPEFSGKWLILQSLLRSWKHDDLGNHKVLVFSSSVKLLTMLDDFIKREYNCVVLHGGIKDEERVAAVDAFQNDKNVFVFLISTLAGGVGLNLTAANKVIIFDPNWNPAHDLQAMDRAFRMGQKRDVHVYRLISLGTIEENIYERQMRKSAAMRIVYDNALESREFVGNQGGAPGDLWGATNLFTYNPEGTTLQRKARLAFEEDKIEKNIGGGIINSDDIKAVKIDTSYGEEVGDMRQRGTEKGTEMAPGFTEDSTLLEVVGDLFPGLRREGVAKLQNKPSVAERFVVGRVAKDAKNPAIANRPANEYYQSEEVAKKLAKEHGRVVKRTNGASKTDDDVRKAPRLNLPKSERYAGLVSDDE